MSQDKAEYIYRKDYREPDFWVDHVTLDFDLGVECTTVTTRLDMRRNLDAGREYALVLDGDGIEPSSVTLDGCELSTAEYRVDSHSLTINEVPKAFSIETVTQANPRANQATCFGICTSRDDDIYTQCEATSFRSFAYMLDRPDVLAEYTVTLRGDRSLFPTLLSNGHLIDSGDLDDGRHWATFHDPIPKPTFIFAILAGDLACYSLPYRTVSGRDIEVSMYARNQYMEMCKPSMKFVLDAIDWDEKVFNAEYDLDVFRFGILNGFMGAMENKGLNLFDINWIVAHPTNTTDEEYEYRMKTTAHEYFHNWSGDRVTIRDWFQVTLKEGLTRFRDQLFLADMTEFTSTRIKMCRHIRNNQFTEDVSPTAHACVWSRYIDPRNLFTNTVYDKGQEIIFMLYTMIGRQRFCDVVSNYFQEYASQAVTIEEFLECFERHAGLDLSQFRRWYYQAGLTEVHVSDEYDPDEGVYTLRLRQNNLPTPGEPHKDPLHIPFAIGLLDEEGEDMPTQLESEAVASPAGTRVLDLKDRETEFRFVNVQHRPVLSRHRFFSAPVRLAGDIQDEDLAFLTCQDNDQFARWDAGQIYAGRVVSRLCDDFNADRSPHRDDQFLAAFGAVLSDQSLSARAISDFLTLPDERTLGEEAELIDVDAVHWARGQLHGQIAEYCRDEFFQAYRSNQGTIWDDFSSETVGRRKLMNVALEYLMALDEPEIPDLVLGQLRDSSNMSEQYTALSLLAASDAPQREEALHLYQERWRHDQLAYDKWYRAQAVASRADTAQRVNDLMNAEDYDISIFGRLFTLFEGFFFLNRYGVNEPGGNGYKVFARQMIRANLVIPLITEFIFARSDLPRWNRFSGWRQSAMRQTIQTIAEAEELSVGLADLCKQALAES
jgi:aminopeptidase N